jgi:hypothetical protein
VGYASPYWLRSILRGFDKTGEDQISTASHRGTNLSRLGCVCRGWESSNHTMGTEKCTCVLSSTPSHEMLLIARFGFLFSCSPCKRTEPSFGEDPSAEPYMVHFRWSLPAYHLLNYCFTGSFYVWTNRGLLPWIEDPCLCILRATLFPQRN